MASWTLSRTVAFGSLIPFPDGIGFGAQPSSFSLFLGAGYFNSGSKPDLAAAFYSNNQWKVYSLIGDGTGHFTATQLSDTHGLMQDVVGLTVGRLKTGGPADIVVANNGYACCNSVGASVPFGEPIIFFNNGTGSFTESSNLPATDGYYLSAVTIQDFNRDGIPDIGMASADQFAVLPGLGNGNFGTPAVFEAVTGFPNLGTSPTSQGNLVVADFNNDGWPDVAMTNSYGISRLYNVPVPSVSPGSLTWSAGGSQKVTIKNTLGSAQAIQAALAGANMSSFAITSNTCGSSLAAGSSCTITVEYISGKAGAPTASNTLWVRSNGSFIAEVQLLGTAD